jgi:glycosyltransferase involved in cell wall biosynthesis
MSRSDPKIVVITPIKNEAWILERFLSVTSQFADFIIIADQNSTDDSVEICKKYPKVTLIANNSDLFNEADRQILLIKIARELVPEHKILLALDADEILAANAMQTLGWQTMLKAPPGTVLYFEKPDLFCTPNQCIRYDLPWPLGYVDDGVEHKPRPIHSIRIPQPEYALRLYIHDVKILHYGLTRLDYQRSKARFYSVIENTLNTNHVFLRRFIYSSKKDYTKKGKLQESPKEWFQNWEQIGIDMFSIFHANYYWQDYEILKYFSNHGIRKFWLDDIWDFDWETLRIHATSNAVDNIPISPVKPQHKFIAIVLFFLDNIYIRMSRIISITRTVK